MMVSLMRRWHADVGGDWGKECGAKIELKATNSRVRRFLDAKARQLGIGKLVVVESRGRFVLMEHLSRAKRRWGGSKRQSDNR